VFFQQGIENGFRDSKARPPKMVDSLAEVDQTAMRRKIENPQRAGYVETFSLSRVHALAIIHQQQVGMEGDRQLNGRFLACVNSFQRNVIGLTESSVAHLQPGRRIDHPMPYGRGRFAGGQFVLHSGGEDHFFKQGRKRSLATDH
jgi:hypothetical protein